jgi:hypothetical protein
MKYVQLSYYIASNNEKANKMANAMRKLLRRRAMHFDGSCWLMREDQVPHNVIHEMEEAGMEGFVTPPFEEDGKGVLNAQVIRCLVRDLTERLESMGVSADKAGAELEKEINAEMGETREAKLRKYKARCRAACKRMQEFLDDAKTAAENLGFDLGSSADLLLKATSATNRLQSNFSARAAAYAAAAHALGHEGMKASALGDDMPVEVLHDALVDEGNEKEATELALTFNLNGAADAVPAEEPAAEEDEGGLEYDTPEEAPAVEPNPVESYFNYGTVSYI